MLPFNREQSLCANLNDLLANIFNLPARDSFSNLNVEAILRLKVALASMNNLLTLKVTIAFVNWLAERLHFDQQVKRELEEKTQNSKPNTNGFDVWIQFPTAVVAEVKCNVPINKGARYSTSQQNGINADIRNLLNGKRKAKADPKQCLKFMAFLDIPQIRDANKELLRSSSICKDRLVFLDNKEAIHRLDVVHGVYVWPAASLT